MPEGWPGLAYDCPVREAPRLPHLQAPAAAPTIATTAGDDHGTVIIDLAFAANVVALANDTTDPRTAMGLKVVLSFARSYYPACCLSSREQGDPHDCRIRPEASR